MVIAAAAVTAAVTIGSTAYAASEASAAADKTASATRRAATTQAEAAQYATDIQNQQFQQTRGDLAPYRDIGREAIYKLHNQVIGTGSTFGDVEKDQFSLAKFQEDPGYQFRLQQGQQALERSASARGGIIGGRALKDLTAYGQGQGAQEYGAAYQRYNADRDRVFNRLSALAGLGQTATTTTGAIGAQAASQAGEYQTQAGNARASGYIGEANAYNVASQQRVQAVGAGAQALGTLARSYGAGA